MSIIQRHCECSLAAICNLNGLDQAAYEALSDKVRRKHGIFHEKVGRGKFRWIAYGIQTAKQAGLLVPEGYIASLTFKVCATGREPDLSGKGILTLSFFKKGHREPQSRHAVAFDNGEVVEGDGRRYASWEAYVADLREHCGTHRVRIDRIFR